MPEIAKFVKLGLRVGTDTASPQYNNNQATNLFHKKKPLNKTTSKDQDYQPQLIIFLGFQLNF